MSWFESVAELVASVCNAHAVHLHVPSDAAIDRLWTAPDAAHEDSFRLSFTRPGESRIVDPATLTGDEATAAWVGALAIAPVASPSADIGWLAIAHEQPDTYDQTALQHLQHFAALIETQLDEDLMHRELDRMGESLRTSERALAETQAQLEMSNRELEQFAYIAAHELVAPLRSVAVYAEVLATITDERSEAAQKVQECVGEIRQGVQRMTEQVQYLLTLSRAQQTSHSTLDLVDTTRTAYGAVDTLAEMIADVQATVTVDPLPAVLAHEIPLQSVFANLLTNAIRYRHQQRRLRVHITGRHENDGVVIEIADNAVGVSEEAKQRIFGLFERGSAEGDGLGVGLAVSRRILETFDASISVTSSDEGSTFALSFPRPGAGEPTPS